MDKRISNILLVFLMIFLIGCVNNSGKNYDKVLINNGKKIIGINAEIADDNKERIQGLMFREKLDGNSGMLFVFDDEDYQQFWMKNTIIPLDIIFIGKNFEIVDIKNAEPCRKEPCEVYASANPSKYVLEVNLDFASKNNIKIGDIVTFSLVK